VEGLLVAARFLHHGAALVFFGVCLFGQYAGSARRIPYLGFLAVAAATTVLWLYATVAGMTGSLDGVDADTVGSVLTGMGFGRAWLARGLLLIAGLACAMAPASRGRSILMTIIAGLYLAGIGLTGHPQALGPLPIAVDAVHLLAAGAWLGGLVGLAAAIRNGGSQMGLLLKRFSAMGTIAASALVGSGVVNAYLLVGSLDGLASPYGKVLIAKLALFAVMAALAAANRWWISPRFRQPVEADAVWTARLKLSVLVEQAVGALLVASVAWLGTLAPPGL